MLNQLQTQYTMSNRGSIGGEHIPMQGELKKPSPEIMLAIDYLIDQKNRMLEDLRMLSSKIAPVISGYDSAPSMEPSKPLDKVVLCPLAQIINSAANDLESARELILFLSTNQQLQ